MDKIAMVLTGHFRSFKENFESLKHFLLDKFDIDIYVSTWDKNYIGSRNTTPTLYTVDQINELLKIYPNVKKVTVNNYDIVNEKSREFIKSFGKFKECNDNYYKKYAGTPMTVDIMVYNVGQWYAVEKGFESIDNPGIYSKFFRNRFDIKLLKPINFNNYSINLIAPPGIETPKKHNWKKNCNVRNQLFYGNKILYDCMKNIYGNFLTSQCSCINLSVDSILEYIIRDIHKAKYFIDTHITEYKSFEIKK